LKAALKRGVETGTLVQVKASYKLSAEAKKKPKAAAKPKAAVKKTTTATKAAPKKVSYRVSFLPFWLLCLLALTLDVQILP
jgi:hypothetical protein